MVGVVVVVLVVVGGVVVFVVEALFAELTSALQSMMVSRWRVGWLSK